MSTPQALQFTTATLRTDGADNGATRELIGMFWDSPFPATLQNAKFLLVAVNDAYVQFSGFRREDLLGQDPILLQPEEDRALSLQTRERLREDLSSAVPRLIERRLVDATGRTRWFRAARRALTDAHGELTYLAVLQDCTAEHTAREQAERSARDLDQWFDISPLGMVLFDTCGSLLRVNPAFENLAGAAPLTLTDAPAPIQQLLAWDGNAPSRLLAPGAAAAEREAWLDCGDGSPRRVRALVRCYETPSGHRRYMAAVEDMSVEEEREQTRSNNEQLLRELHTILESSPAGIVYLRGDVLVRCNRRFELMIGLKPGAAAGRSARVLFAGLPAAQEMVDDLLLAIRQGKLYETEFKMPRADGVVQWCSLTVRSERSQDDAGEAIGMLSDITRLKTQQAELETLARDRELMFSLSEVGIAFIRDGRIQRANEALQRLAGYDAAALAGLDLSALFPDAGRFEILWSAEEIALREHGRWSGEREIRRSNGELLWVQVSKRLVTQGDPAGGIIASYVNVDDRHRAESLLALQAERTRAVLDSVLVGIVIVDRAGIEWMNRSARRMFGGSLADFVGHSIATVASPEADHPFRRTHYIDALLEGQTETFECRVMARDGRQFWVAGNVVASDVQRGGRQLTYALLDIEQRRQAEVRIAQAQASLQRIIDLAPLAITLRDASNLRVLQINPAALTLTGKAIDVVIGSTPEEIYEPQLAARLRADMLAACGSTQASRHEYVIPVGGVQRVWDASFLPLATASEGSDQLLLVATDVTEQRAADKARLEAAIAQREMLVKEVHHRIKNNLQGVAGLLQQIAVRRPEVASIISEVVGQVQAIAQVYGLQVGAAGPLHIASVAEAIVQSVQRTFGREIAFNLQGSSPRRWILPEAEAIPIALTLNELLTNAIKHGGQGNVVCDFRFDDAGVRISISNPGTLPKEFDLAQMPTGVSGLGLVRALLPRRNATLSIAQRRQRVEATIELVSPGMLSPVDHSI